VWDAAIAAGWRPEDADHLPPSPEATTAPKPVAEKTPEAKRPTDAANEPGRMFAGVDYSGDMRDPR